MRIVFFASGGPGNFQACLDAQDAAPGSLSVRALVVDRPGTPSEALARSRGIPVVGRDFDRVLHSVRHDHGPRSAEYARARERLHDEILEELQDGAGQRATPFDLAVLAYRRIVSGALLEAFAGRMINQHPADLTRLTASDARAYVGIAGFAAALRAGEPRTRTSTILVDAGVDTGPILCQGPWLPVHPGAREASTEHEQVQKSVSDWPALRFCVTAIADGKLGLAEQGQHADGSRIVVFDGWPLPLGGVDLAEPGTY